MVAVNNAVVMAAAVWGGPRFTNRSQKPEMIKWRGSNDNDKTSPDRGVAA